ncbi:MAG: hypothetical protein AB1758_20890 [Candidatus Eremiobacterota bacterium]
MKYVASTPTRIDLAGGTLDLYPLFLFEPRSLTVNAGIDLRSHVTLSDLPGTAVRLRSVDFGATVEAASPQELDPKGELGFLALAVQHYLPGGGVEVVTRNTAPKGSGLGASSSLLMALSAALCRKAGRDLSREEIIRIGSGLEARSLGIPTGLQDYFGAMFGGFQALRFDAEGSHREPLEFSSEFRAELGRAVVVSFTGLSHFSGTSNWNMLKRYIEKEGDTVQRLGAIAETAWDMRDALVRESLFEVGRALEREWNHRKGLADGVTTPEIDAMVQAARQAGALASKICGAGGGGCLLTLAVPDRRAEVEAALAAAGARVMQVGLDARGLELETASEEAVSGRG